MRLDLWFRFFNHATLAAACLCLIYGEIFFLPVLQAFVVPLLVLIAAAALTEGRWCLPNWAANLLGLAIAVGGFWWVRLQLTGPSSAYQQIPMPAALVPPLGPVLLALMLVKLFRPRQRGDFWLLQGMGLLQVGLGCVLANDGEFGLLLTGYLACALVCLGLYYLHEQQRAVEPAGAPARTRLTTPGRAGGFVLIFSLRWMPGVAFLALVLFLITPRREMPTWDPLSNFNKGALPQLAPAQVGFETEINLNRVGNLEVTNEVAFRVVATLPNGQPKLDLSPLQRWRGAVLDAYEAGRWESRLSGVSRGTFRNPERLPDLGSKQFYLTFVVRPKEAGGLFLAEPVWLGPPGNSLAVRRLTEDKGKDPLFFAAPEASVVLPRPAFVEEPECTYRQVAAPLPDPERYPAAVGMNPIYVQGLAKGYYTRRSGLEKWTWKLVNELTANPRGGLSAADLATDESSRVPVLLDRNYEKVARALSDYLTYSGEYTYTLDLRREDLSIDPALDFLKNVKQGNCERYATGLALMLRALGIPARVVKGFRGAESQGQGIYFVRQSMAHAWVEALVPTPPGKPGVSDWLTLDPTPVQDAPPDTFSLARWYKENERAGASLWHDLIVDYNRDHQAGFWHSLLTGEGPWGFVTAWYNILIFLALLAGLVVLLVRLRRRQKARRAAEAAGALAYSFYTRLLALLARYRRLQPRPAQTPREFASASRAALQASPLTRGLAHLPARVAELFYRVRFGHRPLDEAESRSVEADLEHLNAVLAGKPRPGERGA